jgi:uncharacterized protein YceH (UPF0502 family)
VDRIDAVEGRVLGALVEKQLVTPQQYPLTLNALLAACNQTSNREPVTVYDEAAVLAALESLRARKLVRFVLPSHGRAVVRYRHVLDELLGLDAPQMAVLAVLVLRGPQTVGELRARTDRMAAFGSLHAVEHELELLATHEEVLARRLARRPGQKEERWTQLLADPLETGEPAEEMPEPATTGGGHHLGWTLPPEREDTPEPLPARVAALAVEAMRRARDG